MEGFLYLGLCVLSMTLLFVGLREVKRFGDQLLLAITFNYISASAIGLVASPDAVSRVTADPALLTLAGSVGLVFISLLFLMGLTAQRVGVAYMTVVSKMSLVLPVIFSWLVYNEVMDLPRALGVLLALVAVFLINYRPDAPVQISTNQSSRARVLNLLLIVILFAGNGLTDILFKVFNMEFPKVPEADFTVALFGIAGIIGSTIVGIQLATGRMQFNGRMALAGLLIGIPNYYSIIFLNRALQHIEGPVFFPLNNIGLLFTTGMIGLLIYREKLNRWNVLGLVAAMAAVGSILLSGHV